MRNKRQIFTPHIRGRRAASFIEMAAGIMIFIPIVFLFINLGAIVIGFMMNGDVAQKTARAAAAAPDGQTALLAAQGVLSSRSNDGMVKVTLDCFNWQPPSNSVPAATLGTIPNGAPKPSPGQVLVVTKVKVTLPVHLPLLPESVDFSGISTQPIVGVGATMPN